MYGLYSKLLCLSETLKVTGNNKDTIYNNNFTSIIDIYFYETFSTLNSNR